MTKAQKRELQYKIKVEKSLGLLLKMQEPISRAELEKSDNVNPHAYQSLFAYLAGEGLIVMTSISGHSKLWQDATKFVKKPESSLADPIYVHKETHPTRLKRRSPRVWPSGAQTYAL
jgi:hypothetical protein